VATQLKSRRIAQVPLRGLFVLMLLLAGCGGDSDKTVQRVERSVESWAATLNTTVEQWEQDRVPPRYVRQLAAAADKALAEQEKTLKKVDAGHRDELQRKVSALRERVHEVSGAVERNDRDAARAATEGGTQ
jgi:outer membrane murein-binding lipoprotein Lpp